MEIKVLTQKDDLEQIALDINRAYWDEANEMSVYSASALKAYLARQDTIFLACYASALDKESIVGIASSRLEIKPYKEELWLYVDEIDVCANFRNKGVGKCMMQKLVEIAKEKGCKELWLGTEDDNLPANALYRSMAPSDVCKVIGYTYNFNDR